MVPISNSNFPWLCIKWTFFEGWVGCRAWGLHKSQLDIDFKFQDTSTFLLIFLLIQNIFDLSFRRIVAIKNCINTQPFTHEITSLFLNPPLKLPWNTINYWSHKLNRESFFMFLLIWLYIVQSYSNLFQLLWNLFQFNFTKIGINSSAWYRNSSLIFRIYLQQNIIFQWRRGWGGAGKSSRNRKNCWRKLALSSNCIDIRRGGRNLRNI